MAERDNAPYGESCRPRHVGEAGVRVIGLPDGRLGEAADILARRFHDNPNFEDLFPQQEARVRALPRMFAAGLRDALGFGQVYAATQEAAGC